MQPQMTTHLKLTISEQDLQRLLLEMNGLEGDTATLQDFEIEHKHGLIVLTAIHLRPEDQDDRDGFDFEAIRRARTSR